MSEESVISTFVLSRGYAWILSNWKYEIFYENLSHTGTEFVITLLWPVQSKATFPIAYRTHFNILCIIRVLLSLENGGDFTWE
jgi:hypothetical protein